MTDDTGSANPGATANGTGIIAAFTVPHPPLIVPAVGRGHEAIVAKTIASYDAVAQEIAALKPDTIVISSPHAEFGMRGFMLHGGTHVTGDFGQFRAPGVRFSETIDTELRDLLAGDSRYGGLFIPFAGPVLDHGTMVPLWFIRKYLQEFTLLVTGYSDLDIRRYYEAGQSVRRATGELGRRAVYVASGDLSHKLREDGPYGFAPEGPEYDARIMDVLGRAAFSELFDFDTGFRDRAAECGHLSFVMMAGALDGYSVKPRVYSHEDATGVGYGICSFMRI